MATPRNRIEDYPEEFFRLFHRTIINGSASVPLSSQKECERLRDILYSLRTKLLHERRRLDGTPRNIAQHCTCIRFRIRNATLYLHFKRSPQDDRVRP